MRDDPPKIRATEFWWKCAECNAELRRTKRTFGTCFCWECDTVQPPVAMMARWGHEWVAVAWMAGACKLWNDGKFPYDVHQHGKK